MKTIEITNTDYRRTAAEVAWWCEADGVYSVEYIDVCDNWVVLRTNKEGFDLIVTEALEFQRANAI